MGIHAAWKALFSGDSRASQSAGGLLAGITPWSPPPARGTKEIQQGYVSIPYLHSIARRIAEEVAAVPFQVLTVPRARRKSFVQARGMVGAEIRRKAMARGEMQPLDAHPFLDVLAVFNPALPGFESRMVAQLYADLNGQAPLVRENDGAGRCLELWPIPPQWVAEMPRPDQPAYRVAHGSWNRLIPEEAMVWGRVADPINPYGRGTSFGRALSDSLDVIQSRDRFIATFFRNDAKPAGILAIQNASPDVAARKKEEWNARYRGPDNAGKIDVTTGATSFTSLTPTPQQLQIAESRGEARSVIQEVLWVPPEILGVVENSNRSTIDAAYYLFARGVMVPRLERWVSWLQPLLEEYGDALVLGYVNPVPEDEDAQRAYKSAVPTAFRLNEHRRAGGEAPLPGVDGEALFAPPAAPPAFGAVGLAAGDPPWAKSLGQRTVVKSAVAMSAALEALRTERLTAEVGPVQDEEFQKWAERTMRELGVSVSFDMRNPLVRQALEKAGERVQGINSTTADHLRRELQDGVSAGEGIRELTARVDDVFNHAERYRSERIARTETVGLSNAANLTAWHQSGVVEGKEWLSVRDGQTREEHRELDGQRVGLDEAFRTREGKTAQHPGGFGVAELDINCRCTGLPVVSDPTKSVRRSWTEEEKTVRWKAFDKDAAETEDAFAAAFRRGFERQREDVLAALRSAG